MGDVRKLWIEGPAGRLEAALRSAPAPRAVAVVAHPHPLHGGTLHNPVVFRADRELNRAGCLTLRFNFRGVGTSEGEHDEGRGEVEDVAAALDWLSGLDRALPRLLVGYSFGAWCALRAAVADPAVAGVVALGFPLRYYPLAVARELRRPLVVVQGKSDELGTPDEIDAALAGLSPPATVEAIAGATHLFPGHAETAGRRAAGLALALVG